MTARSVFSRRASARKDAITARRVNGSISNLTNVLDTGKETFADFRVTADVLEGAPAVVAGSVNAFAAQPTFDVNLEVKKVELPQVNPWLREYIKADAEAGKFELYMELAAADGKFKGYAKPILQDVDIYRSGEEEQSALKRVWEGFLDFAANVLENQDADQVAARIPFSGTIKDPETSLFATIASVMRNAFISAFARSLEGSITLRDVKKNLNELDPNEAPEEGKDKEKKNESKHGVEAEAGASRKELIAVCGGAADSSGKFPWDQSPLPGNGARSGMASAQKSLTRIVPTNNRDAYQYGIISSEFHFRAVCQLHRNTLPQRGVNYRVYLALSARRTPPTRSLTSW